MPHNSHHFILVNILLILTSITGCFAQSFQWAKQMGSTGWDEATSIVTDQNNNVYTVGLFRGTVDFDPGTGVFDLTSVGEKDAFICKLDADGNFLWAKQYGDSASIDERSTLAIDAFGNLYTTNSFVGSVDFDPGPSSFSLTSQGWDRDVFVQKLDQDGNFIWAKQISAQPSGAPSPTHCNAIAVDASGDLYFTGYFDGSVDFDPDSSSSFTMTAPMTNGFVCKWDANGQFVWAKEFEGVPGAGAVGYAIAVDANNQVYSTGTIGGTVDFDPGAGVFNLTLSTPFQAEAYISKLDAMGNFVWVKSLGTGIGYSLALDESGHVYASNSTTSGYTPFLNKLDGSGSVIWANSIDGVAGVQLLTLGDGGLVYAAGGCCIDTADLDPGPGAHPLTGNGSFIATYDSLGNFVSAGFLEATVHALTTDLNNGIYATGFFQGTTDFDIGPSTFNLTPVIATAYDAFVLKLKADPSIGISENSFEERLTVYPNPTAGNVRIEFENEQEQLTLVLRNVIGQELDSKTVTNSRQVDLQINESQGIYLLEVLDQQNKRAVLRIVKQ